MKFCKVPLAAVEVWGQQLQNGGWGASSSLTSHTKLSSQTEVQPICLGRYLAPYLLKIQAFLSSTHLDTDNKLLASAGCCVAQQPSFSGRVAPLLLADSASLFPGVPAAGWAGLGWAGLGWLGWAGLGDICRIVAVAANSGHRHPALWRHRTGGGVAGHKGGGVLSTAFIPHTAPRTMFHGHKQETNF